MRTTDSAGTSTKRVAKPVVVKPRPITAKDNALTLPGRVTFPVGTYTNPSTAVYGQLGGPSGGQPSHPPTLEEQLNLQRLTYAALTNGPTGGQGFNNLNFGSPNAAATSGTSPTIKPYIPGVNAPPVGHGIIPRSSPYAQPTSTASNTTRDDRPKSYQQALVESMAITKKLPTTISPADLSYMQNQGLDTSQLAQFYVFDPKTGRYGLNQQGAAVNQQAGAQPIGPGQYVDPGSGEVKRGTTPFGTNAAGQRLDASGNVWDPKTAATDIYGGRFIQVGEVRWERNKNGKLVRVQYGKGGKKTVLGKQAGKMAALQEQAAQAPAQAPTPQAPKTYQSQQNVNFNTASG